VLASSSRGNPGEPIARLTPLSWTCIGNPNDGQEQTLYNRTYFVHDPENRTDIDNIVFFNILFELWIFNKSFLGIF
jgi:hypothetical protein